MVSPDVTSSASVRRRLPWVAPVAALVVVVAAFAAPRAFAGSQHPNLPARTPTQLVAAIDGTQTRALSGTLRITPALGLPKLPGSDGGNQLTTLATEGSQSQIWVDGLERQRIALLGTGKEMDVIRDGSSVWTWDTTTQHATHRVEGGGSSDSSRGAAPETEATPMSFARNLVNHLNANTVLSTGPTTSVAGHSAYTLVLRPRTTATLIGQAVIDIDAHTGVPLGVSIYPRGTNSAGFREAFSSVSFATPSAAEFRFTPPVGRDRDQRDVRVLLTRRRQFWQREDRDRPEPTPDW
jgi:outer membrane lipoprotein-sorting protein